MLSVYYKELADAENFMDLSGYEEPQWCSGSLLFVYVVPSLLFFISYLVTCVILRFGETEHLQTLLERVREPDSYETSKKVGVLPCNSYN